MVLCRCRCFEQRLNLVMKAVVLVNHVVVIVVVLIAQIATTARAAVVEVKVIEVTVKIMLLLASP